MWTARQQKIYPLLFKIEKGNHLGAICAITFEEKAIEYSSEVADDDEVDDSDWGVDDRNVFDDLKLALSLLYLKRCEIIDSFFLRYTHEFANFNFHGKSKIGQFYKKFRDWSAFAEVSTLNMYFCRYFHWLVASISSNPFPRASFFLSGNMYMLRYLMNRKLWNATIKDYVIAFWPRDGDTNIFVSRRFDFKKDNRRWGRGCAFLQSHEYERLIFLVYYNSEK